MMKKLIQHTTGQSSQAVQLKSLATLQPQADEIVIDMLLSPIHNHNIMQLKGIYGYQPPLPAEIGTEAVGIVSQLGKDVQNLNIGQRVIITGNYGTWADQFIVPAKQVMPIPEEMPNEIAAQVLSMPLSAWMVLNKFKPKPNQWLIMNAAAGAVGKNLIVFARSRQLKIIALIHKESVRPQLEALDTHMIINTTQEDWQEQITTQLNGEEILYGLDSIGGKPAGEMLSLMGKHAQLLSFGAFSGEPLSLNYQDLIFKEASVSGFWASQETNRLSTIEKSEMMKELMHLVTTQQLQLPAQKIFALDDYVQAFETHEASNSAGKIMFKGKSYH